MKGCLTTYSFRDDFTGQPLLILFLRSKQQLKLTMIRIVAPISTR